VCLIYQEPKTIPEALKYTIMHKLWIINFNPSKSIGEEVKYCSWVQSDHSMKAEGQQEKAKKSM
jgi:hypothetical protein